jgi:CubicO group peptidase (beta-lactamase class C family)
MDAGRVDHGDAGPGRIQTPCELKIPTGGYRRRQRFADLARARVAGPAGLEHFGLWTDDGNHPRLLGGRTAGGAPEPAFNLASYGAAYGSAEDMARLDRALLTHVLLAPDTTDQA